jgi:hypothetical protein
MYTLRLKFYDLCLLPGISGKETQAELLHQGVTAACYVTGLIVCYVFLRALLAVITIVVVYLTVQLSSPRELLFQSISG